MSKPIENVPLYNDASKERHDFINHIQVIFSLIQTKQIVELEQYMRELIGEMREMNDRIHIGHPAINALIQSKLMIAREQNIDLQYQFTNLEQLDSRIKSIDIVKIMGNLIDNAFDEVLQLPKSIRRVELQCTVNQDNLNLIVRNRGRYIHDEELNLIFNSGYSTKTNHDHFGIGLSIVKERVEFYKGTIQVQSCPDQGIQFHVEIPLTLTV